jgi:hypothetical protein
MFSVLANYDVYLSGESYGCMGEAVFREWREPDEFGDPGKVIKRRLIEVVIDGSRYTDEHPVHKGRKLTIRTAKLARQPTWELEGL